VAAEIRSWRPDLVLLYNLEPYHCAVTGLLRHLGIPWVPIVLDHPDPVRDNWGRFQHSTNGASGVVFVSDWGFRQAPNTCPRLHLDGGVELVAETAVQAAPRVKRIVYSGKYSESYGGMGFLFAMFAAVRRADCELVLTGKEVHGKLAPYLKQEPRARHLGHLDWEALHQVYADAAVFVNPGTPDSADNRMNFPSKLLDYLPWGKPIISTWTAGMAAEYRDLLVCPEACSPQAYGAALSAMLDLSNEARLALREKLRRWCEGHTWESQARRLLGWMEVVSRKQLAVNSKQ
jgi:glycosyltransferase involved in cell wall biosynthesis